MKIFSELKRFLLEKKSETPEVSPLGHSFFNDVDSEWKIKITEDPSAGSSLSDIYSTHLTNSSFHNGLLTVDAKDNVSFVILGEWNVTRIVNSNILRAGYSIMFLGPENGQAEVLGTTVPSRTFVSFHSDGQGGFHAQT